VKSTGKTVKIDILPSESVAAVKKEIQAKTGMAPDEQSLTFGGEELVDSKTLEESGIKAGSTLEVEPLKIPVTIKTPMGKTLKLDVNPSDTIENVKKVIQEKTGMRPDQQRVLFGGKELENDRTVKDCGIKKGSTLSVEPYTIPITVKTSTGKTLELDIWPSETVAAVKKVIQQETGLSPAEQRLTVGGKELVDSKTLEESGIKAGSTLDVEPFKISVTVTTPMGKTLQLDLLPSDTIENVKKMVQEKTGMRPEQQLVLLNGEELEDGRTVKECGIQQGSTLAIDPYTIPIIVKTSTGKTLEIDISPSETIDTLKNVIQQVTGLKPDEQCLTYGGKELTPGDRTLQDCGITKGAELSVEPHTIPITVTSSVTGETASLDVKPSDSILNVKKMIQTKTKMPVDEQILKLNGKKLSDSKSVQECGIKKGSGLTVEASTPVDNTIEILVETSACMEISDESGENTSQKVDESIDDVGKMIAQLSMKGLSSEQHVFIQDRATLSIRIDPSDSIETIKKMIQERTGTPHENQCLFFKGQELKGGSSAEASGLKNKSRVKVEPWTIPIKAKTAMGKTVELDVSPGDTIDKIKKAIKVKTGIKPGDQIISFQGKELENHLSVEGCGIKKGSLLEVGALGFQVTIITRASKKLPVTVSASDTVDKMKAQIHESEGISPDDQLLYFDDVLLIDGATMSDCNITEGSVLILKDANPPAPVVSAEDKKERAKKCYMWYSRLGCPNRKVMIQQVKTLPKDSDITIEDVDALPWSAGGLNLNVRKMNELFMNPADK
jgi:ubiquitin